MVYDRINKELNTNFPKQESTSSIQKVIVETELSQFKKKGKIFYISNHKNNIRITVNSNTYRIITVDLIKK